MVVNEIVTILNKAGYKAYNKFINITIQNGTANVIYDTTKVSVSDNLTYRLRHYIRIVLYIDDPDTAITSASKIIKLIEPQLNLINPIFADLVVSLDGTLYVIEMPFSFEEVVDID